MSIEHGKTRDIYHKQHTRIVNDDVSFNRIRNLYQEEYFGLGNGWFNGKKAADLGCGDTLVLSLRLAEFGAKEIWSMDLGTEWQDNAKKQLDKYNIENGRVNIISGNVVNVPMESESFDFVACNGVLCHLSNRDEVEKGFSEGARVCKKGGYYYTTFAVSGGLLERAVFPALQKYYTENEDFKKFIDNLEPNDFEQIYKQMAEGLAKYAGETMSGNFKKDLFDEDLCITIQNYIQGPNRYDLDCNKSYVEELYRKNGFTDIIHLKRYPHINNVRKYLSPIKYERESLACKLLYGEGFVEVIARKA